MAGSRVSRPLSERSIALTILVVGAVAAAASLFGDIWIVRAGVVAAVVMSVAAFIVAGRQLQRERAEHKEQLHHEVELRTQQAERFHADSLAMIDRFNDRIENLKGVVLKLRRQLAAAQSEMSSMRGNAAWLRGEIAERQARIDALEAQIADLEKEEASNVVELPAAVLPTVDDIWGDDEHPTMVDMGKLDLELYDQPLLRQA
ncbi:hypothetical protein [Tessaracoccus caeni]|uniref:hypothetical protein n=1 Tax=Tessaracoccus caeni TaxID=3031239 RepID=UPI0023DB0052|nr:hypothetical protein [Tessaracoccus caeni]MDF1487731.1 hypothetical protein [Tessaracoccus caeni]